MVFSGLMRLTIHKRKDTHEKNNLGNTDNCHGTWHKHRNLRRIQREKVHAYKSDDCTITYNITNDGEETLRNWALQRYFRRSATPNYSIFPFHNPFHNSLQIALRRAFPSQAFFCRHLDKLANVLRDGLAVKLLRVTAKLAFKRQRC